MKPAPIPIQHPSPDSGHGIRGMDTPGHDGDPPDIATAPPRTAELAALVRRYRPARVGHPSGWATIRSDVDWIRDLEAAEPPLVA